MVLWVLFAYACGCLNGAYYIGQFLYGEDIRVKGSGNAGARNAGRVMGRKAFVYTVIIDAFKTIFPLLVVIYLGEASNLVLACVVVAILCGHIWPVQLQFHGGKGIVVYLAVSLVLLPMGLLIVGGLILLLYIITKKLTIPTLTSFFIMPILLMIKSSWILAAAYFFMLFIIVRLHRSGGVE
ncbi:glycerol-3-phosphate acyltransferase [Cytobacillus kochii]|uniref:glycerol-3-phosphate acyltransferase n=1 Tax=Cytobacillus kochii TaxID=859143 RepID=UPI00384DBED9